MFLEMLNQTVNFSSLGFFNKRMTRKNLNQIKKNYRKMHTESSKMLRFFRKTVTKDQTRSKISSISKLSKEELNANNEYKQFHYYEYQNIVDELYKFEKVEDGKWVKITTAQEEFNLPHPGGFCGKDANGQQQ